MAGIEQLEIHSKSYIVRWVKVDEGHTISWSVQPHKKSVNFGIVKHPGSGGANPAATAHNAEELNKAFDNLEGSGNNAKAGRFSKKDASTAQEQLANKGFTTMKWHGKCEADKVSMGTYDVLPGNGGMFGLVFDNTFSKQTSKTATFVLLTFPAGRPPQGGHHLPNLKAGPNGLASMSKTSLGKASPRLAPAAMESTDSLHNGQRAIRTGSSAGRSDGGGTVAYHTGNLLKRRRKKGQGFARRFFSLDYSSCTLSYYYNRNSSALRGAIPLSLAAIAADERRREISIDSGAEVWHLRASSAKEFAEWARALEQASRIARGLEEVAAPTRDDGVVAPSEAEPAQLHMRTQQEYDDREWVQVETLVSRIVGTRDALRRLVRDMASQSQHLRPTSAFLSPVSPSAGEGGEDYFASQSQSSDKRPFWRRKATGTTTVGGTAVQSSISNALAVPVPAAANMAAEEEQGTRRCKGAEQEERSTHEHCAALLNDLDTVLAEFTNVIANSKRRRLPNPASAGTAGRASMESSMSTDEFFDAEAGDTDGRPQVVRIDRQDEEDSQGSDADEASIHSHSSSSISSAGDEDGPNADSTKALFPAKPKSLSPLPVDIGVERRRTIPRAKVLPPSLIAFVRKNVGKDLSTISMPVSANEPISLLQRAAEQVEYAQLLDKAAGEKSERERLLYVAAFAVSQFSCVRAKERSIRKPFNPLLGETYELLRTESEVPGGFRLIVEKVCHRPVRLALHADAAGWSLTQSPAPSQKFWGKSAEISTEGRVRVALRLADGTDELYSWACATMFLRNVVMGEKYIEPVGNMAVLNETTGARATIEFKAKGMFGGRGEDVQVDTFGPSGESWPLSLTGTWTERMTVVEAGQKAAGREIWHVGDLVADAANVYGMTTFAASLNEITKVEKGRLASTDSRLRPDQRLAEQGRLDEAEQQKARLENAQRRRRKEYELRGEEWKPRWFSKIAVGGENNNGGGGGEEVWRMKSGRDGYWEARDRGFAGLKAEEIF